MPSLASLLGCVFPPRSCKFSVYLSWCLKVCVLGMLAVGCVSAVLKPLGGNLDVRGKRTGPLHRRRGCLYRFTECGVKGRKKKRERLCRTGDPNAKLRHFMWSTERNLTLNSSSSDHSCGLSASLWLQVHTSGRSVPKRELCQPALFGLCCGSRAPKLRFAAST